MKTLHVVLLLGLGFGLVAQADALTSSAEQKGFIEALSGVTQLGVGGLPNVLSQRFSDSPEIQTTAQYLKAKYDELGIQAGIADYDPMDAFPYYFQNTDKTYRSYFVHMMPMLRLDFDGLCGGTLPNDKLDAVLKRIKRVGLEKTAFCAVAPGDRVETYISTTINHSTSITKKLLAERTQTTWPNVLAYLATGENGGEVFERPVCVIGAHMDSVAREGGGRGPIISPATLAPGADDNGSGTAAVLTLARGLRDWLAQAKPQNIKCDIIFAHFSGEEEGLIGSIAFARLMMKRPILWMVNFDMIAYNGSPERHEPILNVGYDKTFGRDTADYFAGSADKVTALIIERETFIYSSDQIAFWDIGVPGVSISEQACSNAKCDSPFKFFNPNLHTPGDVAGILDYEYAANIIDHSFGGLKRLLTGTRN
ncbi:MAG: M28 family peptidase [Deltaproteobacteria bacterium]|nr:M28 family peptidase [Deltaproteobacteria bacterium]